MLYTRYEKIYSELKKKSGCEAKEFRKKILKEIEQEKQLKIIETYEKLIQK